MKLLVVDDQRMFREGFVGLLKPRLPEAVFYESPDGFHALKIIPVIKPDIILLDVNMPGKNGLSVMDEIRKSDPLLKIIILTDVGGEFMTVNLVLSKIQGFLFKCLSMDEAEMCIRKVAAGEVYFCQGADKIFTRQAGSLADLPQVRLTSREIDIISMMDKGRSIKEMSVWLGLSERTVTSYRERLFRKTKTKSANELLTFAYRNGLIHLSVV